MIDQSLIEKLEALYKQYRSPGMALPQPSEYERGFDAALDSVIAIIRTSPTNASEISEANIIAIIADAMGGHDYRGKGESIYQAISPYLATREPEA